jgi:hypothetical protein
MKISSLVSAQLIKNISCCLQVSLMMIVLEFKDYNECQLMRLILSLERKKQIYLRQGIFRVTLPEEGTEGQQSN